MEESKREENLRENIQSDDAKSEISKKLYTLMYSRGTLFFEYAVLFNLLLILTRPQNNLGVLASIQFPLAMSLFSIGTWFATIHRPWPIQKKIICVFAALCILSVFTADNTRFSFEGTRTQIQLYIGIIFPIISVFQTGAQIKLLLKCFWVGGTYLGIYGITHGGVGPGDYLGDENDLCVMLNFFLPLHIFVYQTARGGFKKILSIGGLLSVLAGIVITQSRGGFLGLLAGMGYLFYRSPNKVRLLASAFVVLLFGLPFVPSKYWEDMRTITDTKESTAHQRQEFWGYATEIWLRPENFVMGVGVKNLPFKFAEFQNSKGKSVYGRAVHSTYFQLLPELGLIGLITFLALLWTSIRGSERIIKRLKKVKANNPIVKKEISWLVLALVTSNASWYGVLISAAFVSTLYYPDIWLLIAISVVLQRYASKLLKEI